MAIIPDGRGATSESRPAPPWGGRSGLQTGVHVRTLESWAMGKATKKRRFYHAKCRFYNDFTMKNGDLTIRNMDLSGQNVGFANFYYGKIGIEPMKNGFSLRIVNGFCAGKKIIP